MYVNNSLACWVAAMLLVTSATAMAQTGARWDAGKQMDTRPGSNVLPRSYGVMRDPETRLDHPYGQSATWGMFTPSTRPGSMDFDYTYAQCLTEMDAVHYLNAIQPLLKDRLGGRASHLMEGMQEGKCMPAVSADGQYAWQSCIAFDRLDGMRSLARTLANAVELCERRTRQTCYPLGASDVLYELRGSQDLARGPAYWAQVDLFNPMDPGSNHPRARWVYGPPGQATALVPLQAIEPLARRCAMGQWSMAREREVAMGRLK